MGQHQSKDELLYQQGNIEAIKTLHKDGASLEWVDKEGKTPLIAACLNPNGLNVAKSLLELGPNINAYRPGYHAGTALHHAAKRGLDDTVQLLLSYGANPLIKNDACQTPLEVARAKGFSNVVRTIERQICIFSGWMREFYGPGFLEALAPQFLSRKIWVVVIPCGLSDPMKPLKLELAIYSSLQDAQPRNVIALWKSNVDEIRSHQSNPVLTIFDKSNDSRYKFTSVSDSEQQQLQLLQRACIGATEVLPPRIQQSNQTTVQQSSTGTSEEAMGAIGINASIDSVKENHGLRSGVKYANDWRNTRDDSTHNGWGSLVRAHPTSGITTHRWSGDQTKVEENGWGSAAGAPTQRLQNKLPSSTSSELSCSGWINESAIEEYNGWAVPQPPQEYNGWAMPQPQQGLERRRDASAEDHYHGWGEAAKDGALSSTRKMVSSGVSSCEGMDKSANEEYDQRNAVENIPINHPAESIREGNPAFDFVAPSAPPVPEEVVDEEGIRYPTVDLSPLGLPNPLVEQAASLTSEKENEQEPALCIICWESSVEGACVPCGHMVGCMQCLTQIKSAKGECPVCRVKIDQVIKLYSV